MIALIARHKIERFAAELALPGHTLVTLAGGKAFRLAAVFTDYVTATKSTLLAVTYRPHAVLVKAHHLVALETEEIVQHIWALATLIMFKKLEGELVAEHEEVGGAV